MKNNCGGLVFILALVNLSFAQVIPVPQSGINWQKSTLSVMRFQPTDPSHRNSFKCFQTNYTSLPVVKSLADLGFNNPDSGPLTLTQSLKELECFQQAGWYESVVELQDYAGNVSTFETVLTVLPAELSLVDSTIAPVASKTMGAQSAVVDVAKRSNCTSTTLLADGSDECILEVNLRDRFANVVKPEGVSGKLTLNLPTENAAKNLDASQNAYGAFLAGLYFPNDEKSVQFDLPQEDNQLQVGLRAYVPSLEPDNQRGSLTQTIAQSPQPITLELNFEPDDNSVAGGTITKTISPLFSPWVQLLAGNSSSFENFVLLPLNRSVKIPLQLSSIVEKALPAKLSIDWEAPILESLWLRFNGNTNEEGTTLRDLVSVEDNPQPYEISVSLIQPEGVITQTQFHLKPLVTYLQKIKGENALVRYPASILQGKSFDILPPFEPLLLSASIEGKLITENEPTSSLNLVLSDNNKILFGDWRRRASRNFISLIRGQSPSAESAFNIHNGFGNNDVAYFKGVTLTLTGEGLNNDPLIFDQGVKTIIVEDGNILINRDLIYKTVEDSLGIIVINSRPNDPDRGHVFINNQVQKIVGSYFLDGTLMSTQKLAQPLVTDLIADRESTPNQNAKAPLGQQLLLEGTLVSRNTLGGADLNPALGPNGQKVQRELALIYDLNYLRRYEPLFNLEGERVGDSENDYCFKPDDLNCYPNAAPFIIRYDGRVQALTPPGFDDES